MGILGPGATQMARVLADGYTRLDGFLIARRHSMVRRQATPDFFEGFLLGNGDLGVCLTVRPDALGLHLGKADVWDVRVSDDHMKDVLSFEEVRRRWRQFDQNKQFFKEYAVKARASYAKPWPRPWPCGILWLHWDPRTVRVVRQKLDPADGVATIEIEHDNLRGAVRRRKIVCFVNQEIGHVSVSTSEPVPFLSSVAYYPYVNTQARMPPAELSLRSSESFGEFTCYQRLPYTAPNDQDPNPPPSNKDASFTLCGRVMGEWSARDTAGPGTPGSIPSQAFLESRKEQPLRLDLVLLSSREDKSGTDGVTGLTERVSQLPVAQLRAASERRWRQFWSKSAVEFADRELERIWYHNQYFLACCLREGKTAPGLFGNWTSTNIGTAWHADIHLDYNNAQVYWGVFSSNHAEQHLPYVQLLEHVQPLVKSIARDHFKLPGAFYPIVLYPTPVPAETNPYPGPPWFYIICDAPWAVQSLWWHYLYTQDRQLLRRVYPMMADVCRFLAAYAQKGEDGKYHIIPTVSAENWGLTENFRLNRDAIMDLSLSAFILKATVEASKLLNLDPDERVEWAEVHDHLSPYPKADGPFGEVWLDVLGAPVEHVYNVPATTTPVFPAEQVGIGLRSEQLEIARRTAKTIRLEGGNDLVYQPLARARLGILNLEWFKNEVRYCLLPNNTCFDRTRQIGGRYRDSTNFDYMRRMGIWIENFALPAVLNECLMQSYTGVIRLFPNTTKLGVARFAQLRAAGAFLVDARWDGKAVVPPVWILSEKGARCRLADPWPQASVRITRVADGKEVAVRRSEGILDFGTASGERYCIQKV
jgi:alpha-L-fucosidase 2